ncbi:hypothetical protein AVW14_17670 [Stenotrophomonas maltophilia]|nr:hypothetical protein AVW14_17670 [Stenotrophomonas maltophilia]
MPPLTVHRKLTEIHAGRDFPDVIPRLMNEHCEFDFLKNPLVCPINNLPHEIWRQVIRQLQHKLAADTFSNERNCLAYQWHVSSPQYPN